MKKNAFSRVLALVLALVMVVGNAAMLAVSADDHVHNEECEHACPGVDNEHTLKTCPDALPTNKVDAGCGKWGYTLYQCPVCEAFFADDFVRPASEHVFEETPATCTEPGEKVCTVCGEKVEIPALGHDWNEGEYVQSEDGCKKIKTCKRCGVTEVLEADDEGHLWSETPEIVTKPTYTENGLARYTCIVCGTTKDVTILCEHECYLEYVDPVNPTCTEDGVYGHDTCEVCGRNWIDGKLVTEDELVWKALGHDFKNGTVVEHKDSTCTDKGYDVVKCSRCDATKKNELELKEHNYVVEKFVDSTCTKWGYRIVTCYDCGILSQNDPIAPKGHTSYEDGKNKVYTAPTCTNKGAYDWDCGRCDVSQHEDVDALGCDYVTVTVPATCSQYAYTFTYCTRKDCDCEDNEYESLAFVKIDEVDGIAKYITVDVRVDKKAVHLKKDSVVVDVEGGFDPDNHNESNLKLLSLNPATCTQDGNKYYYCEHCDVLLPVVVIPATGHKYDHKGSKVSDQTCTTGEVWVYACSNCWDLTEIEEKPALGHDYGEVKTIAPTCSTVGYNYRECSRCHEWTDVEVLEMITWDAGKEYGSLEEAQEVHSNIDVDSKKEFRYPTCVVRGLYTYKCLDCGKSVLVVMDNTGNGHIDPGTYTRDEEFPEKKPTCTEDGYTAQFWCACGTLVKSEKIEKLGHNIGEPTCTKGAKCTRCEYILAPLGHDFVTIDERAVDCLNFGYVHVQCERCGNEYIHGYSDAWGHTEVIVEGTKPTCTEPGRTDGKICGTCGVILQGQLDVRPTGHHNADGESIWDSCLSTAEDRVCADCGEKIEQTHNGLKITNFDATCIDYGYVLEMCSDCGYEHVHYIDDGKLGEHRYELTSHVAPTYHETGLDTYNCVVCGKEYTEVLPILEGIGFFADVDNAVVSGTAITDASLIAVTVSLDANNVALWGFKFDLNYDANILSFVNAEFVSEVLNVKAAANDNGEGTVTVAANGSLENTVISESTAVVVLYFRVNSPVAVEQSAITFGMIETVVVTEESSKDVVNTGYGTEFSVDLLLDLNRDGEFNLHDVLALYRIILGESDVEYDSVVDVDRDGEITLIDYALVYEYLVGSAEYEALVDRLPEA